MYEWINKMWYKHTVEYYSALKRTQMLTNAACMNLEEIMLSEISQSQKDKYCMTPLIIVKFVETENRMVVSRV